ncbi:sensor histidine kinase [Pseudobacteroides cellulosolvens]|uniref:Signal transduction histidine kinase regulating citrate/malate metabolism n=1 Tax=Pseudobacteroides cellulosolvens ATCC 35603 = DSM 2933 TaxID=398512 RepID=A0A0L6JH93_9FIRM|nr:GHKL domain-containing protein [Pseudobacteroides cellulosolvens]KNY25085.1 signal transduction histidine kinase regulating citrate/malate metabolism [Pseudobacteroides cellulosolvens ATCC 35603 = DSM 2933]
MAFIVQNAVQFVYFIVQGFLVLNIFIKTIDFKKLIVFSLVNTAAQTLFTAIVGNNNPVNVFLYIIIMILTLKFILGLGVVHSIAATSLLVVISTLFDYLGSAILKISFGSEFDVTTWANSYQKMILLRIIGTVLYLAMAIAVYYMRLKVNIPEDINKKRSFSILANSIISAILIVPNILYYLNNSKDIDTNMVYFNVFAVFVLLILCFYNSIKSSELEVKSREVEFQKDYIKTLDDIIDGLRGFKHDFNNNVQAIGGYIALNDINGLKKYYHQLQSDTRRINNTLPLSKYVKNNPALYGLLLSKLSFAELKDIQFVINIMDEYNIEKVKIYDLCKILGILLDNALEAAFESPNKYVELSINKNSQNIIVIEIINSYAGKLNKDKIFENGYTTKSGHSGFGLWEVNKIISRNQNCSLETSVTDTLFSQRLEIS